MSGGGYQQRTGILGKLTIRLGFAVWLVIGSATGLTLMLPLGAKAQESDFALQVMPSPLVESFNPGEIKTIDVTVRNAGQKVEDLAITCGSFDIDEKTGEVKLADDIKPDIASWISFAEPNFTVLPGQTATQKVTFKIPNDVGFSYHFTLSIKRQNQIVTAKSGQQVNGAVDIFGLVNINRPDAVKSFEITKFVSKKNIYEYLPAVLSVGIKNTGNTIVRPAGNVFIDGGLIGDKSIVGTLSVNQASGYILPGSSRIIDLEWSDGFPVFKSDDVNGLSKTSKLQWNWSSLLNFRLGKYTASIFAVYDDGRRDVPLTAKTSFWVVPWKILAGVVAIAILITLGLWWILALIVRLIKKIYGGRKR